MVYRPYIILETEISDTNHNYKFLTIVRSINYDL